MNRSTHAIKIAAIALLALLGLPKPVDAGETFTQQPTIAASQVRGVVEPEPDTTSPNGSSLKGGPPPTWIWGPDANQQYVLTKEFDGGSKSARLKASSDNV
ncbi:MAG: hypothetical protein ABI614_03360, partial [Planctomycetota bacterium]